MRTLLTLALLCLPVFAADEPATLKTKSGGQAQGPLKEVKPEPKAPVALTDTEKLEVSRLLTEAQGARAAAAEAEATAKAAREAASDAAARYEAKVAVQRKAKNAPSTCGLNAVQEWVSPQRGADGDIAWTACVIPDPPTKDKK